MKSAIDSYCYHRYFGEIYPGIETDSGVRMSLDEFLDKALALQVQGVSLESCFFPHITLGDADILREKLDYLGFERVWAWGHLSGLGSGAAPDQLQDLKYHTAIAGRIGAKVMRICCGSRRTRPTEWSRHKAALLPLLHEAVAHAEAHRVVLAIENHIDLLADELVELIETVNSPWLGVCLDTANNLRMLEDPLQATLKLVPYARTTHIKDVRARSGNPHDFSFWPSVPLGQGLIDLPVILAALKAQNYKGLLALEVDYLDPEYENHEQVISDSIAYIHELLVQ
ncbi:sugar phosphate isomerase/epimerase family protein [Acidocella aminolytica]|jgi:sugar phosphate isomerase/epimerase|uniref:Xylose isomerase n=1 Tax=Acidocella aminolytica 101 = DSM 11237 TaxID=1120923 RepID=A0A0D6PL67_9PROT|nr:sugar phosphate isomerase/epimerase [Acidocella aminolytica]GAN82111.1 xylose isomerase [Acidocella aminolytica 101 = DSM 11237]GBQ41434.1 xylose isomerase domain-containing protein [Acidocella aminolytica 101 = DSM 11237]SHF62317.1 Sugar phosphate isomerase/epimerase [Acidocella aminolytica 101 = DSM 11237]